MKRVNTAEWGNTRKMNHQLHASTKLEAWILLNVTDDSSFSCFLIQQYAPSHCMSKYFLLTSYSGHTQFPVLLNYPTPTTSPVSFLLIKHFL